LLASEYGWTIDYIGDLSFIQIKCLLNGKAKLIEDQNSRLDNINNVDMNTPGNKNVKVTKANQLLSMPGIGLTDRAKKKLAELNLKEIHAK
jgi:hypothetical protein